MQFRGLTFLDAPHCFSVTTLAWLLPSLKVLLRTKLLCVSLGLCGFLLQHLIYTLSQNTSLVQIATADMLSRNNITQFILSNPQAKPLLTPLPQPLLRIIFPQGPDWTSSSFRQCFTDTINIVSPLLQDPPIHLPRQVT